MAKRKTQAASNKECDSFVKKNRLAAVSWIDKNEFRNPVIGRSKILNKDACSADNTQKFLTENTG
jgi:hypothetical protein